MTVSFFHPVTVDSHARRELEVDEDFASVIGPVIAGARARGVADALELIGVAAILMDRGGQALHHGSRVEAKLDPFIRVVDKHLIGADASINDRLTEFLSRITAEPATGDVALDILAADGALGIRLKAVRFPVDESVQAQLLHAILIVERLEA